MTERHLHFDEWEDEFGPLETNPGDDNGVLWETYGKDLEYVQSKANQNRVWTLLDTDEGLCITDGFHYVNRLNYYITSKPYPSDTFITVRAFC